MHNSPDFEGGEKAMIDLLSYNSNLTAVVAYNDTMAAGAISVLNENNIKVPKQFSIVGFDDMPIARYLIPKLTTIRSVSYTHLDVSTSRLKSSLGEVNNTQGFCHALLTIKE